MNNSTLINEIGEKLIKSRDRTKRFNEMNAPQIIKDKELWITTRYEIRLWLLQTIKPFWLGRFLAELVRIIMTSYKQTLSNISQQCANKLIYTKLGRAVALDYLTASTKLAIDTIWNWYPSNGAVTKEQELLASSTHYLTSELLTSSMLIDILLMEKDIWLEVHADDVQRIKKLVLKELNLPRRKKHA